MNKNIIINQLAVKAQEGGEMEFNELYKAIEPNFNKILKNYFFQNNLNNFTFDNADYLSAIGQAIWEALEGFDINRGDFMARVITFAKKQMKCVTDFNLAQKRFDKTKLPYSFEELYEKSEYDLIEPENTDVEMLVNQFIQQDKEGKVIDILWSVKGSKARNKALSDFYGKYESTERKKVQRVRDRLKNFLAQNCIYA